MDAPAGRRRSLPFILVGLVVLGYLALGVSEAWTDAPTFDEPVYVSSGLAALLQHDLVVNDEHPPLDKALAALPVLLVHPMMPRAHSGPTNDERAYNARFVTLQTAAGSLRRVTFVSRLVPLAESIGIALVLFALASELFGTGAGALAAVLWLASPLVLGIGHLDGTDIPFTLAVVLNSWALTRWFRHGSRAALVAVGLAGALLASTQSTGILLVGLDVAVVAFTSRALGLRRSLTRCTLVALLVWLGVWLPYLVLDPATLTHGISIVPRPYLEGISYLAGHDTVAAPGYLLGHAYTGGRWWFWPLSMAIKLPIALLALLVAGAASWRVLERKGRLVALVVLLVPAAILTAFTLFLPRDLGVRYLLPVLALGCAASGALVRAASSRRTRFHRPLALLITILVVASVAATADSFPDSLAWTSVPFRPAYSTVTDSDVDWGQGLYQLESWERGRHPWVAYFGPRGVPTDVGGRPLVGASPAGVTGWVAVSATALTETQRGSLAWLRNFCPVDVLAGSILVYHFVRPPPATGPAPASPPGLCPGGATVSERSAPRWS